jgi:hypothetical protein
MLLTFAVSIAFPEAAKIQHHERSTVSVEPKLLQSFASQDGMSGSISSASLMVDALLFPRRKQVHQSTCHVAFLEDPLYG